jgi:hypothetical protein
MGVEHVLEPMLSSALARLWRSRPPRTPSQLYIFLHTVLPCGSPRPIGNIDAFLQFVLEPMLSSAQPVCRV